jgi:branched-chain amino acid transport system substrate-binding protein
MRFVLALAAGISLAGSLGCSDRTAPSEHKTLPVGFIGQFSNSARIAFLTSVLHSINDAGGVDLQDGNYDLQLVPEDHGGSVEGGVMALQRLADQGVTTVIDPNWSSIILGNQPDHSDGVAAYAKKLDVLIISGGATAPEITDLDDDNLVWRTIPSDVVQGRVAGDQLTEQGITSAAIIHRDDSYGNGLADAFTTEFQTGGGKVVGDAKYPTADAETRDFKAELDIVFANKPAAIMLIGFDEVYGITSQIDAGGYLDAYANAPPVFFGTDGFYDPPSMVVNIPASILRRLQGTIPQSDANNPDYKAAVEIATARGVDADSVDGARFDAAMLIALGLQAAGSRNADDIKVLLQDLSRADKGDVVIHVGEWEKAKAALKAGKHLNYEGASGPIEFSDQGDPTQGTVGTWKVQPKGDGFEVVDGKIVPYSL